MNIFEDANPSAIEINNSRQLNYTVINDETGLSVDPADGLFFSYSYPGSEVVIYTYGTDTEIVRDDVGEYHVNLTFDVAGFWFYAWKSLGPDTGRSRQIFVKPSTV